MSEGFDVAAYRREMTGIDPDKGLLVTFKHEAVKQNDGSFKDVEFIHIWMGNSEQIERPVTESDKIRFKSRYEAFKNNEAEPIEGTPIKMCAFATPADVAACKSERIFTLEQLVETPDERLLRAKLVNLKYRSRDWLEAQKRHGYVGELRAQIDALKAQIESLKSRLTDRGIEEPKPELEVTAPKKRGRPPKVTTDAEHAS
jgi:hypothetical protein